MTPRQIVKRVQVEADARFGETIERLLFTLRGQHTHQCWKKECWCDYCQFIRGQYVDAKMHLHKLKKHLKVADFYWDQTDTETRQVNRLERAMWDQKQLIRELKQHKKDLQKDVI